MRKNCFLIVYFCIIPSLHSFACNCLDKLNLAIESIEKNYAGYEDKTAGEQAKEYLKLKQYLKKDAMIADEYQCFLVLSKLVFFFRDYHLSLFQEKKFQYKNIDSLVEGEEATYFSSKDNFTGYWITSDNRTILFVKKTNTLNNEYKGYVYKTTNPLLKKNNLILLFSITNGKISPNDYCFYIPSDSNMYFSPMKIFKQQLTVGYQFYLTKILKREQVSEIKLAENMDRSASMDFPNDSTSIIKIPASSFRNRTIIDSLVQINHKKIISRKFLLIDVRGNTGGTVQVYMPLYKYLHINPIIGDGEYVKSSEKNITFYETVIESVKTTSDSAVGKYFYKMVQQLKKNPGRNVYFDADTIQCDTLYEFPRHVGIITDLTNASAVEFFLLNARQSKNVRCFGEAKTLGAVDYADFAKRDLCDGVFLRVAMTKRGSAINKERYDQKGIPVEYMKHPTYEKVLKVLNKSN